MAAVCNSDSTTSMTMKILVRGLTGGSLDEGVRQRCRPAQFRLSAAPFGRAERTFPSPAPAGLKTRLLSYYAGFTCQVFRWCSSAALELKDRGRRRNADVGVVVLEQVCEGFLSIAAPDRPKSQGRQQPLSRVCAGSALQRHAVSLIRSDHS